MKTVIQVLLCAVIGFVVATLVLNNFTLDFMKYADVIVITMFVIIFTLLGVSMILYRQIKKLHDIELTWDEEDEMDLVMYKKVADYSFYVQSSLILSIMVLCTSVIASQSIIFTIIALGTIMLSYLFTFNMTSLLQIIYPERNIPNFSDSNYGEKLLEISDEGEKHVMLVGFYKSFNLMSVALIIAIVLATFYSISTDHSQLFSIVAMSFVLIIVHGKYCITIRNK